MGEQQRLPAYQKVIQKTACDAAPPLVYQYSKATSSNDSSKDIQPSDITVCWQDKFLSTLREIPQRFCSADDLLNSVPLFAEAMGARKVREQKELLVMFLEGFPDIFRVEKRGSGSDKQYIVWAK